MGNWSSSSSNADTQLAKPNAEPLEQDDDDLVLDVPTAVLVACAAAVKGAKSNTTSPISIVTHLISSVNSMDDAINEYIDNTREKMSAEDDHLIKLYYDATKQCLAVSSKIYDRATQVRSELRKIDISHDFAKEGSMTKAMQRLEDVDTNKLSLGDELDGEVKFTIEAYEKVSTACQKQLKQLSKKETKCTTFAVGAVIFTAVCAIVAVGAFALPAALVVTEIVAMTAVAVGVAATGAATLGAVLAVRNCGETSALRDEIIAQTQRLEGARRDCCALSHHLKTIQPMLAHATTKAQNHAGLCDEATKGLPVAYLETFFANNFEGVVLAGKELEELCASAVDLHNNALKAFGEFAEGGKRHQHLTKF